jgi:hypothetical protein
MNTTRAIVVSALIGVAMLLLVRANPRFAGNWEGKMNGLPAVNLSTRPENLLVG